MEFIGRQDSLLFFTSENEGVIVESTYHAIVATGSVDSLKTTHVWSAGEFSEADESIARIALSIRALDEPATTQRQYTIPRGVQAEARRALAWNKDYSRGATPGDLRTAGILAAGGQLNFENLRYMSKYFPRHEGDKRADTWSAREDSSPSNARIAWGLRGGDSAQKWATAIVQRESVTASVDTPEANPFASVYELDENTAPEFLARIRFDGEGIDRLYKIDFDGLVYVWDDGGWDNLGSVEHDIWTLDRALDDPYNTVESTHVVIDPDAAIILAARFQQDPMLPVPLEELEPEETRLAAEALDTVDWELIDTALTAAGGTPGDGIYSPDERSENAGTQVRDKTGKFAKTGSRVMVGGNPAAVGKITRVNPADGSVSVMLENGNSVNVPGKSVEGIGDYTTTIPGRPVEVPRVDTSGILAEPRTPINRVGAQLPGTLPAMTAKDLKALIYDWPAWVKGQRDSFKSPVSAPSPVNVQSKNSTKIGKAGEKLQKDMGKKLTIDAYDHPLLKDWLKRSNADGSQPNSMWYRPLTAAAAPADAGTELTPETTDVPAIYLAIVDQDDPRAVLKLVSLLPASSTSTSPMTYVRQDGKWTRDPKVLNDLNSATPPPIVPLDSETLDDVLQQVDSTVDTGEGDEPVEPVAPVVASVTPSYDQILTVLFGPTQAITAAGGTNRNRGKAEDLRRYWTRGAGAAKIRWGSEGDWTRCVRHLSKYLGARSKGYCALRHKEMTGMWTGDKRHRQVYTRRGSASVYSDALVASLDTINSDRILRARVSEAQNRITRMTPSATTAAEVTGGVRFRIPLVIPEETLTGDKRIFEAWSVAMRSLPLPLLWQEKTADGHDGSYVVGRIDSMERIKNGIGNAVGVFDTKGAYGAEAERMVREGFLRGVSADMDNFEAAEEAVLSEKSLKKDEDSEIEKQIVVSKARVMGVTIVAKPAFQECFIVLDDQMSAPEEEPVLLDGLYIDDAEDPTDAAALVACGFVAGAIPVAPPTEWFENPGFTHAAPISVDDTGRVFGHIAVWDMDHIGMNKSTKPPRSKSNYAYFNTGALRTEEGKDVPVGQLTLAGGHPSLELGARAAIKHYDDTASAVADVRAGEDNYGIWVAGSLRPGVTPEQIRALRASAPSGDWRPIRGHLELVAVCQVNVPGFPVARAWVASGQIMALVAAGAAPLAHMREDPIALMSARLERLEQFTTAELSARAQISRARLQPYKTELSARVAALSARIAISRPPKLDVTDLRARVASAANKVGNNKYIMPTVDPKADAAPSADPKVSEVVPGVLPVQPTDSNDPKFTPKTQPRDAQGQFRTVLARLRSNLGTTGNQAVLDKLQETENLDNTGDYVQASKSAGDLIKVIDRMDAGALNADSIVNVRNATTDLSRVIANLPLPFSDQAEKVRYSDLPPALKKLTEDMIMRVEDKLGSDDAEIATQELKDFMSGSDVFSQSEISAQLNRMLRLLT